MKDRKHWDAKTEDALLDELEALTSKMKGTSQAIQAGTSNSLSLIDSIHSGSESSRAALVAEGRRAIDTRNQQNKSSCCGVRICANCGVYMIIFVELFVLIYLLYQGLFRF